MSKLKDYQRTLEMAQANTAKQMANNNFAEHGLNQNGDPLRTYTNERNEATRVVDVVNKSPNKKFGEGALKDMWNKGRDEIGHVTRAFHDADTVPVAPSYLDTNRSPLQDYQQHELHEPAMQQIQEIER